MTDLADAEKEYWKGATERRKQNAIRLKRLCFHAEKEQVEAFMLLYDEWLTRWGKTQATDAVIGAMADFEARYQDLKRLVSERRKAKRSSGPKGNSKRLVTA